jgi:hypothetical protein
VTVAFRLLDRKGVSNFGVRWQVSNLATPSLKLAASLNEPEKWQVALTGDFESGFGPQPARAQPEPRHLSFIVMTAADQAEFAMRHGKPGSPERVAQWLDTALQAWHDGICDGVVTYCLDKLPNSPTFELCQKEFARFMPVPQAG